MKLCMEALRDTLSMTVNESNSIESSLIFGSNRTLIYNRSSELQSMYLLIQSLLKNNNKQNLK